VDKWGFRDGPAAELLPLKANKNARMGDVHTGLEILRLTALHSGHHNLSRNQV
jgi:hypothetical protein